MLKVPYPECMTTVTTKHELQAVQNTPAVTLAAGRSYRDQVVEDEVEANSSKQITGYGVELAFLCHHGLQQGGLPSVTTRGLLARNRKWQKKERGGWETESKEKVSSTKYCSSKRS